MVYAKTLHSLRDPWTLACRDEAGNVDVASLIGPSQYLSARTQRQRVNSLFGEQPLYSASSSDPTQLVVVSSSPWVFIIMEPRSICEHSMCRRRRSRDFSSQSSPGACSSVRIIIEVLHRAMKAPGAR